MDRETIERCAKVAAHFDPTFKCDNRGFQDPETGEVPCGLGDENCECGIQMEAAEAIAQAIRALPSEPPASHAIITKLIGYAGHKRGCDAYGYSDPPLYDCTCGYNDTLAEARKFLESGDE